MQPLCDPITIRPIQSEADYEDALAELARMIGHVEPGTAEGNRYALLASMVEAYEDEQVTIEPSDDPIAMIEFVLDARGLSRKDLEPFIGTRQRVWDIKYLSKSKAVLLTEMIPQEMPKNICSGTYGATTTAHVTDNPSFE